MIAHYFKILTLIFFLSLNFCLAQTRYHNYNLGITGNLSSSKENSFWNYINQYGIVPTSAPNILFIADLTSDYKVDSTDKKKSFFDWGYELAGVGSIAKEAKVFIPFAYLKVKLGAFQVSVGKDKGIMGLIGDSTLSSGSFAMSGNASPYPRIQVSIPRFVPLSFLKNFVAIQGTYSDGLLGSAAIGFGNVAYVPKTYMHQKSLYVRLGIPHERFFLYGGFNHQAIWGGESKIFTGGLEPKKAYKYVVYGKIWAGSRVGNHFGTVDLGLEYKGFNWTYFLYRQSLYEDGSLSNLSNIADGLNGIVLRRNNRVVTSKLHMDTFLTEFIYTKNQGGEVFDFATTTFGRDNYYNHYVYRGGWSYKGKGLGSPVIPDKNSTRSNLPSNYSYTNNNRLWALQVGMSGYYGKIAWKVKSIYSQNYGTYDTPFNSSVRQLSYLIHAEKAISFLKGSSFSVNLSSDFGKLYPNSTSVTMGLKKTGIL